MARLPIKTSVLSRLFAMSGNLCAYPSCPQILYREDGTGFVNICHIHAVEEGWTRYDPDVSDEALRAIDNLVLMCRNHHGEIDQEFSPISADQLREWKRQHEAKFTDMRLVFDPKIVDRVAQRSPVKPLNMGVVDRVLPDHFMAGDLAEVTAQIGIYVDKIKNIPPPTLEFMIKVIRHGLRGASQRVWGSSTVANRELTEDIRLIHAESSGCYGSPRVHATLRRHGRRVGRSRVERLMRRAGLRGLAALPRRARTTNSRHDYPIAPNRLARNFKATAPNQIWLADLTYIPTGEGWLYLAAILDMHTRKIVGWSMRQTLHAEIALDALNMAVERQRPAHGLIHHSDRGIQYAAEAYRSALARSGITPSMSRKGDCWDNAPMESFFHTLKTERVHHRVYATRDQARRDLFGYIEGFYNPRRLHSALGYISPAEAERRAA